MQEKYFLLKYENPNLLLHFSTYLSSGIFYNGGSSNKPFKLLDQRGSSNIGGSSIMGGSSNTGGGGGG